MRSFSLKKFSFSRDTGNPITKTKSLKQLLAAPAICACVMGMASNAQALICSVSPSSWDAGYTLSITVTNDSDTAINSWEVSLSHSDDPAVSSSWATNVSASGNTVTASNVSWNGQLSPGQSTSFGYQGAHSGSFTAPTCSGDGVSTAPSAEPTPAATPTPTPTPTTPPPTAAPTATPTPAPTSTPAPAQSSVTVLQEDESGFCGVEGSVDDNNSGFTGVGFANTENESGKGIEWSVNVQESGNYDLYWRYANGSSDNRSGQILVNGSEQANIDFGTTGGWTSWQESSAVTVYLDAGDNVIRAVADTGGGLANIDSMSVVGSGVAPGSCSDSPEPTPTPTPEPSSQPTATPTATPTPTPQPTQPPVSGSCPTDLIGWATTNGGTTGGGNSTPVVVSNASELRDALSGNSARVVHFSGTIDTGSSSISIGSNKTLQGTTKNATIRGGLSVSGNNVIVRNFTIQGKGYGGSPADTINGDGNNIWFDHLNVLEGGDGLLDLVNGADRVTTSWNKFSYTDPSHGHRLALLFGNSSDKCSQDGGRQRHTIHHNWFGDLVNSRMPRLYFGKAHIFNNYYNSPGNNYAIGVGTWASALIENNYFKDVKNPHRRQNDYPTYIEANGNVYDGTSGNRHTGGNAIGTMPDRFSGSSCHAGLADPGPFNPPYNYSLDSAESVPELVQRCAGPQ